MTEPIAYDQVVRLSPRIRRLTQKNPGLFTGPGTNTHLIGEESVVILDPGEDRVDGHLERVVAAVSGARVVAVIPSHGHPDHWPLAPRLARAVGAPIWFYGQHSGFRTDRSLGDGDRLPVDGVELEAVYTPGHTRDHLAFRLPAEQALFPGDLVMGWSTSIIAPPDGDLRQYQASLERLLRLPDLAVLYPAHGEAIDRPYERIRELHAHRELRTRQALEVLESGPSTIGSMVERIYHDVDQALYPAAAQSLLAHLLALDADGRIVRLGAEDAPLEEQVWRLR